ncbi:hypothetical protein B566_EDAN007283 [Ephemera danica]|nr:hypothetical protein B566_EDAN007283 [Ephemera danica]
MMRVQASNQDLVEFWISTTSSPLRRRHTAPDENAENSQDSGVGSDPAMFRFAAPFGMAPRSRNSPRKPVGSPQHEMSVSPAASPVRPSLSLFHSLSSGSESVDDGFLDFLSIEKDDEAANLPRGLGSLLCGEIMRGRASPMRPASSTSGSNSGRKSSAKRSLHRSLSMADTTPVSSRARSCLFRSPSVDDVSLELAAELRGGFKRPDPPTPCHDMPPTKRRREQCDSQEAVQTISLVLPSPKPLQQRSLSADQSRPRMALTQSSLLNYGFQRQASPKSATAQLLQRSFSESEASIKKALQRSLTEPDLIGDFSRNFALPLTPGRHPDLKTIAPSTLAQLLRGEFDEDVASYAVIDCRYPYEYSGGHIRGSRNVYSKDQVSEVLICGTGMVPPRPPRTPGSQQQRHVLVFHCEFSSERAPSMSRHLRQLDRDANKECYPQLHYPEVYLLHGGYKAFYETHPELCDPCSYVPMLSQGNEADLRHFRAKSRSWADPRASAARLPPKHSLKRLEV